MKLKTKSLLGAMIAVVGWPCLAPAQVRLVYVTGTAELPIVALRDDMPLYRSGGGLAPIPGGGEFKIVRAPDFAEEELPFHVIYHQGRPDGPARDAQIGPTMSVDYAVVRDGDAKLDFGRVFFVAGWQVGNELLHVQVRSAATSPVMNGFYARIGLAPGEEGGFLRVYFFDHEGRSFSGVPKNQPEMRQLRDALDAGDRESVLRWAGAYGKKTRITPNLMSQAAKWGDVVGMTALLGGKTDILQGDAEGLTVLHSVAQTGHTDMAARLLEAGARINARTKRGLMPLQYALSNAQTEMVRLFVRSGAALSDEKDGGFYPIGMALGNGDLELALELKATGAPWPGKSTLEYWLGAAVASGRTRIAKYLLEQKIDPNTPANWSPALSHAIIRGDLEMARLLLHYGAQAGRPNKAGITPLMSAAGRGDESAVDLLLGAGADPASVDKEGWTAATHAVAFAEPGPQERVVSKLVQLQPPTARQLTTMLGVALTQERISPIATWLIEKHGARLHTSGDRFAVGLRNAVQQGVDPVVALALEQGVSPNFRVGPQWSLAALARRYGRTGMLALLEARAKGRLEFVMPEMVKEPVQVWRAPSGRPPVELLVSDETLEAEVELLVDPSGVPHFPKVLTASPEAFAGPAAVIAASMRFNTALGKSGAWRQVAVPVSFLPQSAGASSILAPGVVDLAPVLEPGATESREYARQSGGAGAAWLSFVVGSRGEIVAPRVLAATDETAASEGLRAITRWKYRPAQKDGRPVWCQVEAVVTLPDGAFLPTREFVPLGRKPGADFTLPRLEKSRPLRYPGKMVAKRVVGLAVLRFRIMPDGTVQQAEAVCANRIEFAEAALECVRSWRFKTKDASGERSGLEVMQPFLFSP